MIPFYEPARNHLEAMWLRDNSGKFMTPEAATQLDRFHLSPELSTFTVQAFSEGLLSAFGHDPLIAIKDFSGEVRFTPGTFEHASMEIRINADSLSLATEVKEKDRQDLERTMRDEVLETAKYPEVVFQSNNIAVSKLTQGRSRARVIGERTLHGVTRKNSWVSAEATVGENSLRAQGNFSLKQTDFGIKPYSAAGGTIKLKNELKFSFDIGAQQDG